MSPQPQQIGIYRVLETLSSGLHTIYKVQGPGSKPLALKTAVQKDLSPDELRRFLREAEVCSELDHRNLMQVFDSGEADGILYQAMDLLVGADWATVLASGRALTWPQKISMMQQACEGMEYAHKSGLVHRSLQPSNLFLEDSGRVRILDFGKVSVDMTAGNSLGITMMFQSYTSPELVRGGACTAASDVFALGSIFYELCTGRHPFGQTARSLAELIDDIMRLTPPPVTTIVPDAPPYLDHVLQQALNKDPASRPADAGALRALMAQASARAAAHPAYFTVEGDV
jgi:serine/threonine-protein kinase